MWSTTDGALLWTAANLPGGSVSLTGDVTAADFEALDPVARQLIAPLDYTPASGTGRAAARPDAGEITLIDKPHPWLDPVLVSCVRHGPFPNTMQPTGPISGDLWVIDRERMLRAVGVARRKGGGHRVAVEQVATRVSTAADLDV